jgi:hypothetical protein
MFTVWVNELLMHTDDRQEHVTQQYSLYYSHICRRDYIVLTMMIRMILQSCTYTIPKNFPEGARWLHNNYRQHQPVGYTIFTDDINPSATQYLPTTSSPPKEEVISGRQLQNIRDRLTKQNTLTD